MTLTQSMSLQNNCISKTFMLSFLVLVTVSNWISWNDINTTVHHNTMYVDAFQLTRTSKTTLEVTTSTVAATRRISLLGKNNNNNILLSIRGGSSITDTHTGDDDDEEDNDEDKDNDESTLKSPSSPSSSATPIKLIISTTSSSTITKSSSSSLSSHNPIIHPHNLEITISSTRTLSSLKQSISKQLFRNVKNLPIDLLVLKINGDVVKEEDNVEDDEDDEVDNDNDIGKKEITIGDLLDEYYDENDLDDDIYDNENEEEDEDNDIPKLKIQVDIIPPVNSKFGTDINEYISNMSNEQLLNAYVMNNACMYYNLKDLNDIDDWIMNCMDMDEKEDDGEEDGEKEMKEKKETKVMWNIRQGSGSSSSSSTTSLDVQTNALLLKEQIMSLLPTQELELLKQEKDVGDDDKSDDSINNIDSLSNGDVLLKESLKRKMKRRGGATMNVKRTLQKNLNIVSAHTLLYLLSVYKQNMHSFYTNK